MHIDLVTSLFFNALGSLIMSVGLFFVSRGYLGDIKGFHRWAFALLFQGMGWTLATLTTVFPMLLVTTAGSFFIQLSFAFYYHALVDFKEADKPVSWIYGVVVIAFLLEIYVLFVEHSLIAKIIVISIGSAILLCANAFFLLAQRSEKIPASHQFTGYVFLLCAFVMVIRAIYYEFFIQSALQTIFHVNYIQDITHFSFYGISVGVSFGFVLMCNEKYMNEKNAAQLAVQEALNRLEKIASRVPGIVYQLKQSPDGYFSVPYSNNGFYDIFSITPDDVCADNTEVFKRIYADDYAYFIASIQESAQQLTPWFCDFRVQFDDASVHWLQGNAMPQRESDGSTVWHGFMTDITELRENEQQLRILSVAVEQSPASIMISDRNTHLIYVNPRFTQITGYSADDVIGKNARMLRSGLNPEAIYQDLKNTLQRGDIWHGELINRRKNGEIYWEEIYIAPVRDAHAITTHYVAIKLDIGARKQAEEQLIEAKQLADSANKAKSDFLANMSHEIRTPMNGIIGLTQLLLDTPLSLQQRDYLSKIASSSQLLLSIINDILDFSKIEAGYLQIEQVAFNLSHLLDNINSLFHGSAAEKGLVFSIENEPTINYPLMGDALRLQQVLNNLLSNAIKFTQAGQIILTIRTVTQNENTVSLAFSVRDTGMGMSEDYRQQLFKPFVQADSSITRRFGGTGLGLAISRKLLQLMGSDFEVSSVLGGGTTFSFTLEFPVASSHDEVKPAELEQNSQSLAGIRLLVAEDNPVNQIVIKGFLQRLNIIVDIANDGTEVLQLLARQSYDGVLMDMQMPKMGGVETTEHIRRQARFQNLPVIALTAGVTAAERNKCQQCGMNDFIAKPLSFEELVRVLNRWMTTSTSETDTFNSVDSGASVITFTDYPHLQIQKLLQIQKDIGKEFPRFLGIFTEHSKQLLKEIHESLANNELAHTEIALHSLKGMCATLGGTRLFELCKAAEALANTRQLDTLPSLVFEIEEALVAFEQAVQQALTTT